MKTYSAALALVREGFGPQAAMFNRALFEGMAVAHWVSVAPEAARQRWPDHERHNALLWTEVVEQYRWDAGTKTAHERIRANANV